MRGPEKSCPNHYQLAHADVTLGVDCLPTTPTFQAYDFSFGQSPYYIPPELGVATLVTSSSDLHVLANIGGGQLTSLSILSQ
jgi:hypothetical protein